MGFKLKGAPYDKSNMNIAVYKKDLTDGSIGKSNHTGIILKTGLDPETEQHVIAHEKVHQEQQAKGDLDYDKENFYWKGKTYPRENLNEHNEELPWEKEAYKASEESTKKQANEMGSTKFKLKGHRGNNKPFSQLTSRGLIGASMNDTDGYSQPDYGSSMDNTIDMSGGDDVMQEEDGASLDIKTLAGIVPLVSMMKNVKERGVKEDSTGEKDGASIPAPKSSTTLKRPSTQSKVSSTLRKDLENKNKGSFNKTDQGGKLSANITRLSQTINSKNPKLKASSKKEYAAAENSYNKAFSKYEKEANSKMSITADSKTDRVIQKKTKTDLAKEV